MPILTVNTLILVNYKKLKQKTACVLNTKLYIIVNTKFILHTDARKGHSVMDMDVSHWPSLASQP